MSILMNRVIILVICLMAIICLCTSSACVGKTLQAGGLVFDFGNDKQAITIKDNGDFKGINGRLVATDGKSNKALNISSADAGLSITPKYSADKYKLSLVLEFKNNGKEQRWIETGINFSGSSDAAWTFWDGYELNTSRSGMNVKRDSLIGTFPASAIYTDKTGLCIGIEPTQFISYIMSNAKSTDGKNVSYDYKVRIVVDSGKSEKVEFIIFGFDGKDTELAVLQNYCDAYPKTFNPSPNIDPRVITPGSTYMAWQGFGLNSPEHLRRGRSGWEWCYAPFKRTGDIYGREEFWNYELAFPPVGQFLDFKPGEYKTAKEFRDSRVQIFEKRDRAFDNAMLFYVPSCVWAEKVLANQQYKDMITNEKGFDCVYEGPWVTSHDKTVRIFPGQNKYGDACREDIKKILAENNIAGFAFDVASGEATVHEKNTPSVKYSPGRAYDEQGVFVIEAVEIGRLMDYVHKLKTIKGKIPAISSNLGSWGNYMTCFRSDIMISERLSWDSQYGMVLPTRYMMGRKSVSWWCNAGTLEELYLDIKSMSESDKKEADQGIVDFLTLESIDKGTVAGLWLMPGLRVRGIDAIRYDYVLDAMPDMMKRGWNPSPKMYAEKERILTGRFGIGINSIIGVGNASADTYNGTISISNSANGNIACIYAGYRGESIQNTVSCNNTVIQTNIPTKGFILGKSVFGIKLPANFNGKIEAKADAIDTLNEINANINITSIPNGSYNISGETPDGYSLTSINIGNKTGRFNIKGNIFSSKLSLNSGDKLTIKFKSNYFDLTLDQLMNYPFMVKDSKKPIYIVVPQKPTEDELYAAFRIYTYFDYYAGNFADKENINRIRPIIVKPDGVGYKSIDIKYDFITRPEAVLADTISPDDYTIYVKVSKERSKMDGKSMIIQCTSDKDLIKQCYAIMRKLDNKFIVLR